MAKAITIIHRDGTTTLLASRSRATSISSARQKTSLLSEDVVNVSVTTTEPLPLAIGDRAVFYGRAYTLHRLPQPTKEGERRYAYELTFEGAQYDLLDVHYHLPQDAYGETYYSDLNGHLEVLRWNVNRIFPGKWEITTDVTGTDYKNITASEKNCLAVLQELCSTFEVEFVIGFANGKNTLRITKTTGKTFDRILRYGRGKGLYSLQRTNVNNANITNRLYAYGGTDNLTEDYIKTESLGGRGCAKLCLPGTTRTTSFINDLTSIRSYGVKEGEKNYSDIKPQRIGEVTAIGEDVITFFDTSIDSLGKQMFDLNAKKDDGKTTKYLIAGTTAKITFQTGQLAGYEFDLHSYEHATNKFVINKFKDENGLELPNTEQGAFQIAPGDKYIITDIILPGEYIEAAEQQLRERATADLLPLTQPQVSYKLTLDEAFFVKLYGTEAATVIFSVGDYIHIQDDQIGVDKEVRITQMERDLLRPHTYEITLSDTVTKSTTVKVLNELSDIGEAVAINAGFADPAKARRRWMATQEVLNMVFDPEGDYYSEKIKPLSIETQMLSVGAKSTQFTLQNATFQPNYNGNPNTLCISAGLLVHYGIDPDGIKSWHFGETVMSGLNPGTAYYIYTRCERNTANAQMVLSTQAIPCESDAAVYYFLVGVLNSVMTDTDGGRPGRLVSLTYGSTTINGRFIKTGRIEGSGGGNCYFDLDNDEIGGIIRFVNSNGEWEYVSDVAAKTKQLQDYISNTLPPILAGLQTQVDGKVETWYKDTDPSEPWETEAERQKHVGDIWFNTETKLSYRYSSEFGWVKIEDQDTIDALIAASNAQDTADGKRTVFTAQPYTPYYRGDLWVQGASGDILCANADRANGDFVAADWVRASKYTGDENLNAFIEGYQATISDIYAQLDGVIETWFGNGAPTLENAPAVDWATNGDKAQHVGDIYYNNDDGQGFRFVKTSDSPLAYGWTIIADSALAAALAAAAAAQDTADGKRRVFVATPYPPYDEGDLWANGTFLKVCRQGIHRTAGSFIDDDWMNATEYTGDESLNAFINGVFGDTVSDIYEQLDGKIECWYQNTDPAVNWTLDTEKANHVGDQWYNTSTKQLFRYTKQVLAIRTPSGTATSIRYLWQKIDNAQAIAAAEAAANAQDTADGKRRVFVTTPYPPYDVGDLWTDGADLWRCNNAKDENGEYDSNDWGKATNYTDDSTVTNFINGIYSEDRQTINEQLDGKIETWYQVTDPAANWHTNAVKAAHVGDMWYNTSTKELRRYCSNAVVIQGGTIPQSSTNDNGTGNGTASGVTPVASYTWQKIEDKKAIDAYEAASHAQDTADGKRTIFVAQPTTPYSVGDLWLKDVDGTGTAQGGLWRCIKERKSGGFQQADWVVATYYDCTQTVIDGGVVTSGTVQLVNSATESICAGITGGELDDQAHGKVRIWAGASKENRHLAPFRVLQDGSFVASKGTITGTINAQSGTIGGFQINPTFIGVASSQNATTGNGLSLYGDFIKFANANCWAMIGTNVLPATLGGVAAVGRFNNNTPQSWATNYGLLLDVTGGLVNIAALAKGAIISNSYITSYGFAQLTPSVNNCHIPGDMTQPTIFRILAKFLYSNSGIGLPSHATVSEVLGLSPSMPFAVPMTIIGDVGSTTAGYITGRNSWVKNSSGTAAMNSSNYPYILDNNGNRPKNDKLDLSKGDVESFMLVWDGTNYYAYNLYRTT